MQLITFFLISTTQNHARSQEADGKATYNALKSFVSYHDKIQSN